MKISNRCVCVCIFLKRKTPFGLTGVSIHIASMCNLGP